jgi:hypothetical protein
MAANMDKGIAAGRAADEHQRKADSLGQFIDHRQTAPVTIRRIDRLQTEARDIRRKLDKGADGEWAGRLRERLVLDQDIAFWQDHLESLVDAGVKVYGPEDFSVGDRVNESCTVLQVNKKSLTVQHDVFPAGIYNKLPYDKVRSTG